MANENFKSDFNEICNLELLHSDLCQTLFRFELENNILEDLKQNIKGYIVKNESRMSSLLELGISCLNLFIQSNWTGPFLNETDGANKLIISHIDDCLDSKCSNYEAKVLHIISCLLLDGEGVRPVVKNPELLLIAKAVFEECAFQMDLWVHIWWLMRCNFIHQLILEENSPTLYSSLISSLQHLSSCEYILNDESNLQRFYLEAARIHLHYREVQKSKEYIKSAAKTAGIKVELIGALGKRTHFQERDIAQLTLKVDVEKERSSEPSGNVDIESIPKDLSLNDEVRLNHIKFIDSKEGMFPNLSALDQALILGMFFQTQLSQPKDKLAEEELMPYLSCLLSKPQSWSLQLSALFLRCRLESHHSRTVERAMMQLQSLVDVLDKRNPPVFQRIAEFHCSYLPPRWNLEAELASLLVSLGSINSALEIYLRLQLWEEVIACYNIRQLRHKAAEIIRNELSKGENVKMWCLLGDATDDPNCYSKAWELSNHRSGRAQRHWGVYHYSRKQYAESIPHFQESLSINSLQLELWLKLGFAALEENQWELCANAYRRYCALDSENFEAWNNLAKAYVKMGQKARAWKALQEALKCNYENWQVWDNLMVVSVDCGEFEEVIHCYHRLLDLKEKHTDVEVLEILVTAVTSNVLDNRGEPSGRFLAKTMSLFGRLTGQVTNNPKLWQMYATLSSSIEIQTPEVLHKTAQYLQKAHRSIIQNQHWEREIRSCKEVIDLCTSLANAYLQCSLKCTSPTESIQMLSSAKLPLKGVIARIKEQQKDLITGKTVKDLENPLTNLEVKLEEICREIDKQQNQINTV